MSEYIDIKENGLNLVFQITEDKLIRFLHFSTLPYSFSENNNNKCFKLVELQVTGENHNDHHGSKHTGTNPGGSLSYKEHRDYDNNLGRKLEIVMVSDELEVVSNFQFYNGISITRCWTEVTNIGQTAKGIEYITSFALTGISKEGLLSWEDKSKIMIPHNTWNGECQWREYSPRELGLSKVNEFSVKRINYGNTGTWSTSEYLPMGCYKNIECNTNLFWQIEHNGSWNVEISDMAGELYLQLSGPTENENHWWKNLKPGEKFKTVPVAVGCVCGNLEETFKQLTNYRRIIRRKNKDNEDLPVIFNDYMNCLNGDPTTEKLLPLIDSAAQAGCEYFCIDAGWYSDGEWWDGVGEWLPSVNRFKGGIEIPLNYIKSKGMISGLWLELEVMGVKCKLADKLPNECFFMAHGKRVIDHGRYQLDFTHPLVIEHASKVIDRLVTEYGVGYIKMDYNINAGSGTEVKADSLGDGLLQHNRAYLKWIEEIFSKYPDLIIENCSSGGMRLDYAMLALHSIQSSSDQTDYLKYASIAAASPTAVTPEQCAVWSYPLRDGDKEEVIFNMVNAMLMRIHQSGHLAEISSERFELVKEGISYYKTIRNLINKSVPFWPLGLPSFNDEWISMGLNCGNKILLAVWRLGGAKDTCILPIEFLRDKEITIACGYPLKENCKFSWNNKSYSLSVVLENNNTARLFELRY